MTTLILDVPRLSTYRAIRRAHTLGWKTGLYAGCFFGVALTALACAAFVAVSERREERQRLDLVEAAACHTELLQRRAIDDLYGACVGAERNMQRELSNLVRGCAP